jgi:hypothetical protein
VGDATAPGSRPGWSRFWVILYLLVGLATLDVLVLCHRPVWIAYDPDEYRERLDNCRRRPHDLLVVGGSPVAEGIDTSVLEGLTWQGLPLRGAFNLGLPGATTTETWHAARHGVTNPPRLLVYGVTASDLNDNRNEPEGPRFLMDADDVLAWVRHRPRSAEWCLRQVFWDRLARCWQLGYYRNGIRLWAADRVDRLCPGPFAGAAAEARKGLRRGKDLAAEHGYAPDPDTQARRLDRMKGADHDHEPVFGFLKDYRLGEHLANLHRLLDWAGTQGTDVVLVDVPVSADLERRYPGEFQRYREALAEAGRAHAVRVLSATREAVGVGDEDFGDLIHLNATGAAKFSAWLRRQLEQ